MNDNEREYRCAVCGEILYDSDDVYISTIGDYLGCEFCIDGYIERFLVEQRECAATYFAVMNEY